MKSCSQSSLPTSLHSLILLKDIIPILCWVIWATRNKVAFDWTKFHHPQLLQRATSLALELIFFLRQKVDKPIKSSPLIGWKPPLVGFLKLNIDSSA